MAKALSRDRYSTATARREEKPRFQNHKYEDVPRGAVFHPQRRRVGRDEIRERLRKIQRAISSHSGLTASYQPTDRGAIFDGPEATRVVNSIPENDLHRSPVAGAAVGRGAGHLDVSLI